jgi:hypothetical protein
MSRLFQSETVDGINEVADVLSLHQGIRVVGSLQQWWNQSIATFEDCRTLSGPKELLKTIIELSLTKDIYLTHIKDMYWSKWLLCSYSCFSWDSIWPLYLCSPCALFCCLFYEYLKWIESYCIFDREGEVASSWMLHEEMF